MAFDPVRFLEIFDPSGVGFWKLQNDALGNFTGLYTNDPNDTGAQEVYPPGRLFKMSKEQSPDPLSAYPRAIAIIDRLNGVFDLFPPTRDAIWRPSKCKAIESLAAGGEWSFLPQNIPGWGNFLTVRNTMSSTVHFYNEEVFDRPGQSAIVGFRILPLRTSPHLVSWNPPRKPRKWGRSLTERWEEEHKQLVAHRKFKRNAAKVEADSMALRKPKGPKRKARTPKMELSLLNSILNQGEASAKRAAMSAAKAAKTATRKHAEKRGAKRVVTALAKKLKRFGHGPAEKPKKRKTTPRRR